MGDLPRHALTLLAHEILVILDSGETEAQWRTELTLRSHVLGV